MKKLIIYCGLFISALAMMTSCGKSSNGSEIVGAPDYIPFKFESDGQYGLLGKDGKPLFSEEFDNEITAAFEGIFVVKGENGTYSLYKAQQKPELVPGCEDLVDYGAMSEGLIPIVKKDSRISFVDKNGKEKFVLKPHNGKEITKVGMFYDGRAQIQTEDGKFGYIDKNGKVVIEPKYNAATSFMDGVAFVTKKEKDSEDVVVTKIDKNGKEIKLGKNLIPYRISGLGFEMPNELCFKVNKESDESKSVLIDDDGKITKTFPKKVEFVVDLQKDNYIFKDDEDKFGLNNSKDETIIRAKYEFMQRLSNGNFLVEKSNDKYDIINEKDEPVKSFSDDYGIMTYYPEFGLILAKTGTDKYELLDIDGNKVSQDEFIIHESALVSNSKSYTATSDYFNADELAKKIVSVLTAKGIGKLSIGETFAIGNPENYTTYQKSLSNFDREEAGININILPQKGDISTIVSATDYIVNYNDQNKIQFNPEAKINSISLAITLRDFKSSCEVTKSIIKNLKAKGHKGLVSSEYFYFSYRDNSSFIITFDFEDDRILIIFMKRVRNLSEEEIKVLIEEMKEGDKEMNERLKSDKGKVVETAVETAVETVETAVEDEYYY